MTALACALAFGFALAFVGWVLWLRERRGATVEDQIAKAQQSLVDLAAFVAKYNLPQLTSTVSDLAMKAGLTRKT